MSIPGAHAVADPWAKDGSPTAFLFKDGRACKIYINSRVWFHQLEAQVIAVVFNLPENGFNKFFHESVWHSPLTDSVLSGSHCSHFLSVAMLKTSLLRTTRGGKGL